jgi:hypothetical protein
MSDQCASVEKRRDVALRALKISQTWVLPIFLTAMGACMNSAHSGQQATNQSSAPQFEADPAKGRDFRELSVHPNGQELLFGECVYDPKLYPDGYCWALRYNIHSNRLQHYDLPTGYVYPGVHFSPSGQYVLMTRLPNIEGKEERVRQAFENTEIGWMKADGTGFKVLPLAKGNKVAPIMSDDETRIAYWRATLRPPGSKTFSSNFDVWEVNLNTGQDNLFAGPFAFFERSNLQYLSQDEMLVGAYGPKAYARSMFEYDKKYNHSQVYRIQRGAPTLPAPVLTEIEYASNPSIDRAGNIYFEGQRPGRSLFKKSREGTIEQWVKPHDIGPIFSLVAAPDGSYIAFTYEVKGARPRDGKRGIGLLNTQTSEWKSLSVPPLQSSTPIAVKAAN